MSLPPAVRYHLVRINAIARRLRYPRVVGALAALGLLAIAVPQYLRHPEWRGQYEPAVDDTMGDPSPNLDTLSSEDLADLAEIDNLALLLNQLQPVTSTTLEVDPADTSQLTLPEATPESLTTSPFAQYLERYRLRLGPTGTSSTANDEDSSVSPGQLQPLAAGSTPATPPFSPLQQALNQRLSASPDAATSSGAPDPGPANAPTPQESDPSEPTPAPWMVEGSLPGVNQRFIRTTPQMSPPPGTTGYTAPPNLAPPSTTPAIPAPAALDLDLGNPAVAPAVGSEAGRSQLPSTSSTFNTTAPPTQPSPAPFSAPRPPGVYTGNGYINTFANPSGPGD
jgi:hypothetical protein